MKNIVLFVFSLFTLSGCGGSVERATGQMFDNANSAIGSDKSVIWDTTGGTKKDAEKKKTES